jgi:hypothetical protein
MILESKASSSQLENDPTKIKSVLKAALTGQVDYWMPKIKPAASKGFALLSCLRETGNVAPSALIFVDPPEKPPRQPIEIPRAKVRRANYASWLRAMVLTDTARELLQTSRDGGRIIQLPVIRRGSHRFAITEVGYPDFMFRTLPERCQWPVAGLEVSVLKAISDCLNGDDSPLMEYPALLADAPGIEETEIDYGSVFPDGSYFGAPDMQRDFVGFETFHL